jgi:hypothetical protein
VPQVIYSEHKDSGKNVPTLVVEMEFVVQK